MRPFELLCCVLALSAVALVLFAPARRRFLNIVSLLLFLAFLFQLFGEGLHWQLAPLILAIFLVFGCSVLPGIARPWARRVSVIDAWICVPLIAATGVLSWLMPMFRLPRPSGPYAVGTRLFYLVDSKRSPLGEPSTSGKRELMVQAWYPAQREPSDHLADYQRRKEVTARASYRSALKTNSFQDALVRRGGPYPVLIYNPGWNGERTEGTYQTEEMASHGFIVLAVDHTYFGGLVEFPDGRVASSANTPAIGNFEHSSVQEQWALGGKYVRIEAEDDIFVLEQLATMNEDPRSPLYHQLDLSRVGAMGFSIGGAAAVQMAYQDPRVKAVLNLDGWEFGDAAGHPISRPQMVIYEDKHGVLPGAPKPDSGPTPERMNWQFSNEDFAHVTGSMQQCGGYLLFIAGTHHADFTDRTLFSPIASWTGRGSVPPDRVHAIVNAYALAFFEHFLNGKNEPLLDATPGNPGRGKSVPFSEVEYDHFDGHGIGTTPSSQP